MAVMTDSRSLFDYVNKRAKTPQDTKRVVIDLEMIKDEVRDHNVTIK